MDQCKNQPGDRDHSEETEGGRGSGEKCRGDSESVDETADNVGPQWVRKNRLAIQDNMIEVLHKTIDAARAELAARKRELRKHKYGS